jgi:D-alanyl-D-alanine carboxypeptidase
MNDWPPESRVALDNFYGKHVLSAVGDPTAAWLTTHLVRINLPYQLTPSWDLEVRLNVIQCHTLVAISLTRILAGILQHYGDYDAVCAARMQIFGGTYNYRCVAGSLELSLHAWGAAIDFDPPNNEPGVHWRPNAGMMPGEVVSLFDAEGWKWGGRFLARPDCMHFQATS